MGSYFPDQGLNPHPLLWKHGVLTTGPPGKFYVCVYICLVSCQAPLSMGFSRKEYWSGWPFPPPWDLPDPGIKPASFTSPALAGRFFTTCINWEAWSPRDLTVYKNTKPFWLSLSRLLWFVSNLFISLLSLWRERIQIAPLLKYSHRIYIKGRDWKNFTHMRALPNIIRKSFCLGAEFSTLSF